MIARALRVEVGPQRVDDVVAAYRSNVRPIHARAAGLRHHYVLVDRVAGHVLIVGVWDSPEAVQAIAPTLEPARQRLWEAFGEAPTLEIYEVADELVAAPNA